MTDASGVSSSDDQAVEIPDVVGCAKYRRALSHTEGMAVAGSPERISYLQHGLSQEENGGNIYHTHIKYAPLLQKHEGSYSPLEPLRMSTGAAVQGTGARWRNLVTALHNSLTARYSENECSMWCGGVPWCTEAKVHLSEIATSMEMLLVSPRGDVLQKEPLQMQYILRPNVGREGGIRETPRRVLVEGEPGFGKTTLSLRLAYDWATQRQGYLSSFRFLFLLPLRDYQGSLVQFLQRVMVPKSQFAKDSLSDLWKFLLSIDEHILFILDGLDELTSSQRDEIMELLEGKIFPGSTIIATSRPLPSLSSLKCFQRKVVINGFDNFQLVTVINAYFKSIGKLDMADSLLNDVLYKNEKLNSLARCPLMCCLICILFEDDEKHFPDTISGLFQSLVHTIVRRSLIRKGKGITDSRVSAHYRHLLIQFGKLCLKIIKEDRVYFYENELKTYGASEVVELGFLIKGYSATRVNKNEYYQPIHKAFSEFLAALYLATLTESNWETEDGFKNIKSCSIVSQRKFEKEIEELFSCSQDGMQVLGFLVALLGDAAGKVFQSFSQLSVSHKVLFSLLNECGLNDENVAAVCEVLGSHVIVTTNTIDHQVWLHLLSNPKCCLDSIELVFEESMPQSLDKFFSALCDCDSIRNVRLSSFLGHDYGKDEIRRLSSYVLRILQKPKLNSLSITLNSAGEYEEDKFDDVIQEICNALDYDCISPNLGKLVLDTDLTSMQMAKLCDALKFNKNNIASLHLPHLGCDRSGFSALAQLLLVKHLVSLNITGSIEQDDAMSDKDSSVTSFKMDSEKGTLEKKCSPFTSFSTLDRSLKKYNTFRKMYYPEPVCNHSQHNSGFHEVFQAVTHRKCKLRHLNISKCSLSAEDVECLGEMVKLTKCLESLHMDGVSKVGEVFPVVMGLQENCSLQLLDVRSSHLVVDDYSFQSMFSVLTKNNTLRLLCLKGWTFKLEDTKSLVTLKSFLESTQLRDIDLEGCEFRLRQENINLNLNKLVEQVMFGLTGTGVSFVRLPNCCVDLSHQSQKLSLYPPQLVPLLSRFSNLALLDMSLSRGASHRNHNFDSTTMLQTFKTLCSFPNLKGFHMRNWTLRLQHPEKVLKDIGKLFRSSSLSQINMDHCVVTDSASKQHYEHTLAYTVISNLVHLTKISVANMDWPTTHGTTVGKCIADRFLGTMLDVSLKGIPDATLYAMKVGASDCGRITIKYIGGPNRTYRFQVMGKAPSMWDRVRRRFSIV